MIKECKTLDTLREVFYIVSCGSIDMQDDVSVTDLLPYTEKSNLAKLDDDKLRASFRTANEFIVAKVPDVILCLGKIWLSRTGGGDDVKGEASKFESVGVGRTFGSDKSLQLGDGDDKSQKVNGFHPSHAVNYLPHVSCLRQLLILIVAEACGRYNQDWQEEPWMEELRANCQSWARNFESNSPLNSNQSCVFC